MSPSALVSNPTLIEKLSAARAATDRLFSVLQPEAIYDRPIPERHRLIFYLGHLEAFDWNLIGRGHFNLPSGNPNFDKLFEFGIDPEPGKAPQDQIEDWPAVDEVRAYVGETRRLLDRVLDDAPARRLRVAFEHRLMHAETFAYLLHNLPYHRKIAATEAAPISGPSPANPFIYIPAGPATLGQHPGEFGWDNEFDRHTVHVPAFSVTRYNVTNGEYLKFVDAGHDAPPFWNRQNGQWFYRGMFGPVPLPLDAPVYVTYDQATAYARWADGRLLTEPEFHRAAYGTPAGSEQLYPWGDAPPSPAHGNFDFVHWDPVSVTANPQGDSAFGVSQLIGNGWEWTSTTFGPFPGFKPFDFYPTYSANFFDNAHYVIKGASPRTAAVFTRPSFRNWFRPNYPYVYATFRLVKH